jgi:diguanylate cyclase (GGDEF)-like protein
MNERDAIRERARHRRVVAYIVCVAAAAMGLIATVIGITDPEVMPPGNRFAIVFFAVMLFLGETQPRFWMRFGDEGEVTPGWSFAYAIMLLGSPVIAVATMVGASVLVDFRNDRGGLKIVFNISQTVVALCSGALVLHAFGITRGISGLDHLPPRVGLGVLLGGAAIFAANACLTGFVLCISQGITPLGLAQASFALSMGVDGALLALAPVFVVAIQFSLIMLPLLLITAFLVFHSARTAMKREHEANHDPLTMLLNRRAFDERLAATLENASDDRHPVVLVMDLDRFKDINDRLGHPVGDRLLRSFAERLERILPNAASASRLGGDEFAVVLPSVSSLEEAKGLVTVLHARLSEQHDLSGFPLSAAVSIGAAVAPQHGRSPSALMAAADVAMYRAKQFGSGIEMAVASDNLHDIGRVGLLNDLTLAIGTTQIFAHYQPLVRLSDGSVESVEALVRWQHPEYGMIAPVDFIGMTEQTDLIGPLTEAMLRTSMGELMTFGPSMPKLCVNIAARSLQDRQFATQVIDIIEEVGFPADRLEIEVTERDIVTNSERSALTLARLRAHGVRIAIDDFGTGYSSFLTLRDLRADRLKIDQQFTSNMVDSPADRLIVAKVIEIAHLLGLDVVAEGVESSAVWSQLGELGCDVAQGFAIARPMPLHDLKRYMADRASPPAPEPIDATSPSELLAS